MANTATSMYLDGTDDYIEFPPDSVDISRTDFTIEWWQWLVAHETNPGLFTTNRTANVPSFSISQTDPTNKNYKLVSAQSSTWDTANDLDIGTPTLGMWQHWAFVKTGDLKVRSFINGELNTTATLAQDWTSASIKPAFGTWAAGSVNMYMDQFRVSRVARYGNIDIPTTQLKTWQTAGRGQNALLPHHTKLLIQANTTTTTSSSIIDQSGNHSITASGAAHSQGKVNFGNTAIYFDGTNDIISIADSGDFDFPADFSIEMWINASTTTNYDGIISFDGTASADLAIGFNSNKIHFYSHAGNASSVVNSVDEIETGGWYHVAVGRISNVPYFWLNGALRSVGTYTTSWSTGSGGVKIGRYYVADDEKYFEGYMDGIRICKGQSAYTPNFVPYGGQKNLAVNRGGVVTDARHPSANTHAIRMGQAITATNANTYCLDFDGTADYLTHYTPAWRSSDDRGTIFAWVYPDAFAADKRIFSVAKSNGADSSADYHWFDMTIGNGSPFNALRLTKRNEGTENIIYAGSVGNAAEWHSIAIVSDGTDYTFYIDGTASAVVSGTDNGDWISDTAPSNFNAVNIGGMVYSGGLAGPFDGKIMQLAYFGGSSGTTGVLDTDAIAALHAAGNSYDLTADTGNYDSWTADLKGYWRMGNHHLDSAGDVTIHDASGYGADMHGVSMGGATGGCLTWTTGTTFLEGWQDRGYFTGDKYTALLIQSAHANGSTTFSDSGPGFNRTEFNGTDEHAAKTVAAWQGSDTQGTVIAWVKNDTIAGDDTVFGSSNAGGATTFIKFQTAAGKISIEQKNNDTVDEIQGSTAVTAGLWNCLAWQSTGTEYKLYVNGVAETLALQTGSNTGDWFADTSSAARANISIGASVNPSASDFFDGQIAQVAVWGGASGTTGVLTAAEILAIHDLGPGANLTTSYSTGMVGYWTFGNNNSGTNVDVAGTIFDESTGSDDDLSSSTLEAPFAGHTVTYIGAGISGTDGVIATHKANKSVFGGSSMYFNGTDSEIGVTSPNWSGLDIGTGDFCMEMWINPDDNSNGRIMVEQTDGSNYWEWLYSNVTYGITFQQYGPSSTLEIRFDGMGNNLAWMVPGTWYHIAFTRSDGVMNWYRDGIIHNGTTATNPAAEIKNFAKLRIGGSLEGAYWAGYMDEIRFSVGTPRYTPSIERYANTFVAKGDTGDAYTALQIQSNGAKSGTGYTDSLNRTGYNTGASGGAKSIKWLSTGGDPLGGANTALYFDGTVNTLTFADSADWDMVGNQAFTYEAWIRPEWDFSTTNVRFLVSHGGHGSTDVDGWSIDFDTANTRWFVRISSTIYNMTDVDNGMSQGLWYHWIFTKDSSGYRVYRDGVLINAGTTVGHSTGSTAAGNSLSIGGGSQASAPYAFIGYMDQIRLSKGIARYGGISLRTAQQVVTSSNSDSQVLVSNSTFGTGEATVPFGSDSYTLFLLNGDEVYGAGGTFPAVKSTSLGANTSTVLTITKGDGTAGATNPTQRQGVSAFGANSYYFDGGDYLTVPYHADFLLAGACTFEVWVNLTSIGAQYGIMELGSDGNDGRRLIAFHTTDGFSCNAAAPAPAHNINTGIGGIAAGTWYHVAVTRDSENVLSIFLDGNLKSSVGGISGNLGIASRVITLGAQYNNSGTREEYFNGYMDSVRISTGIARYEYTGTNTKLGLNAVHHSHAKLLITSNTYNGNTHFDDFSDQGNYWNQTPYSYHFDGTDDYLKYSGNDPYSTGSAQPDRGAVVAWVKHRTKSTASSIFCISRGDATDNEFFWLYVDPSGEGGHIGQAMYNGSANPDNSHYIESTRAFDLEGLSDDGQWHLIAWISTGTSNIFYIDGIAETSLTESSLLGTYADGDFISFIGDNTTNITIGSLERNSADYFASEEISQVGVWGSTTGTTGVLTAANIQAMWEAGPTANWTTDYSAGMLNYWAMGNHNEVGGRPADTATTCYDRVAGSFGYKDMITVGTMYAPHKGTLLIPAGTVKHSTDNKNFGSSAIFFDGNSDYLVCPDDTSLEFGTADFTVETWLYSTHPDSYWASNGANIIGNSSEAGWFFRVGDGTAAGDIKFNMYNYITTEEYDTQLDYNVLFNTWAHIALQRSGRNITIMVNGIIISNNICTAATVWSPASGQTLSIGARSTGSYLQFWKGYMDEIGIYNGVAKYTAVALPGKATITPSYLTDPSGNHFTTTGLAITDQMLDTPENNFCTFNPLGNSDTSNAQIYSEGNLKLGGKNGNYHMGAGTTIGMSSGKWYAEFKCAIGGGDGDVGIAYSGRVSQNARLYNGVGCISVEGFNDLNASVTAVASATKVLEATAVVNETWATGDIIGIAVDIDNKTVFWTLNNDPIFFYGSGTPTRSGPRLSQYSATNIIGDHPTWMFAIGTYSDTTLFHANFGQGDPDGENNFTDSNGRGGFRFEPPSGFLSLCTANMKDADYAPIGPNSAAGAPDQHFDTVLWEGNNTQQQVSMNFQPDLVWLKGRQAISHYLFDSLRGATAGSSKAIFPSASDAEANYTDGGHVREMNKSGFVIAGESSGSNETGEEYVAWCWKAGNGSVEDTSGDIAVTRSTNVEAGFSIISYTQGSTATGTTIAHGLGKRPDFFIHKSRNQAYNWDVWHTDLVDTAERLKLNSADDSENLASTDWNPTATTIATGGSPHHAATDQIVYVWTSIEGFSKFGSYYGNNDTDGAFVYLGFKPALLIIKGRDNDARQWTMYSNKIMPYNGTDGPINFADASTVEDSSGNHHLDFLSNGFKVRNVHDHEGNAETYIYMAWAEMPFKYATGR